jgi:hypothetical protein
MLITKLDKNPTRHPGPRPKRRTAGIHCNEIMKLNKLLIGRPVAAPILPSAMIHNGQGLLRATLFIAFPPEPAPRASRVFWVSMAVIPACAGMTREPFFEPE